MVKGTLRIVHKIRINGSGKCLLAIDSRSRCATGTLGTTRDALFVPTGVPRYQANIEENRRHYGNSSRDWCSFTPVGT